MSLYKEIGNRAMFGSGTNVIPAVRQFTREVVSALAPVGVPRQFPVSRHSHDRLAVGAVACA